MARKILPILLTEDAAIDPDRSKRSAAVKYFANRLAAKLQTSIELLHVDELSQYPIHSAAFDPWIEKYLADQKARVLRMCESFTVPVKTQFASGDPVAKILSLSNKKKAYSLIVLGTHGRSGLARLIAGSVAEEVIRNSRVPVMTVGPAAQANHANFLDTAQKSSPIRILVPTALTPNSKRAEDYAVELARGLGASLVLFHSLQSTFHPVLHTAFATPTGAKQLGPVIDELRESALKRLDRLAAKIRKQSVEVVTVLDDRSQSSGEAVLKQARGSQVALIVQGTHGRPAISEAFFGRTARDVIRDASCPVITVHSKRE